jgi:protein arginine kinase activator
VTSPRKKLCQVCGENPVQYQITEARGKEVRTIGVCRECAEKRGIRHEDGTIMVDLKGVMNSLAGPAGRPRRRPAGVACGACGTTLAEFERTGRLGCPRCYEAFARELEPVIRKVQAGPQHRGLVPARLAAEADEIRRLRTDLDAAVREERYEDAARIRDLLRIHGAR